MSIGRTKKVIELDKPQFKENLLKDKKMLLQEL
jgi:hypothetical protein